MKMKPIILLFALLLGVTSRAQSFDEYFTDQTTGREKIVTAYNFD